MEEVKKRWNSTEKAERQVIRRKEEVEEKKKSP